MILDLRRFVENERPHWMELESFLNRMEQDLAARLDVVALKRFHYLYQRTSSDLGNLAGGASEPEVKRYLESLVARAYSEIHETRERRSRFALLRWFFITFPRAFRRHWAAFAFAAAVMATGGFFGAVAVLVDPEAKEVILPFEHLLGNPSDRVALEESNTKDRIADQSGQFSAMLMTHNTRVAILTLVAGITWGVMTIILLFYNGVILGAVSLDYVRAGEIEFLLGWLLPHGVIEIPAILVAGQGGLMLANALIGSGSRVNLGMRLRGIAPDLITLIFGGAVLLVWAGIVESFLSQYHEPAMPYLVKISFGLLEAGLLICLWTLSGRKSSHV